MSIFQFSEYQNLIRNISLVAAITFLVYRFCLYRRVQAKISNIPGPESKSWTGNFNLMHDRDNGWNFFEHVQANYGSVCRITTPVGCNDMLYVTDPLALFHISRKDEHLYDDPTEIHIMLQMVLGNRGLGATRGAEHSRQRKILNPMFSASSLRYMPSVFYRVTHKFLDSLQALCAEGSTEIDMSHWGTRVALELVAQGAAGYSFDSLAIDGKPNLYGEDMKQGFAVFSTSASRLALKYILPLVTSLRTPGFNRFLLNFFPSPTVRAVRRFIHDLDKISRDLFSMKKHAILRENNDLCVQVEATNSKDLMSSLIRDYVLTGGQVDEEEATSHFRTLLFAATDTSSSAILRTLLVLAEHHDIQARVRQEILAAKLESDGDLSYDKLLALPLLDAVYRETMRLYPPASYIDRVALEDTVLPLAFPIIGSDGKRLSKILVPKNTVLTVSIVGVNRSTAIWGSDALEWKPQRWLGELPASVKDSCMPGIYSHMMTFMDGKRHCLGYRYVQMELKIVISELICTLQFARSSSHDKISWPMGITLSPFVDGKMCMPLEVSRV